MGIPVYEYAFRLDPEELLSSGWEFVDDKMGHGPTMLRRPITLKDLVLGGPRCPRCNRNVLRPIVRYPEGWKLGDPFEDGYRCAWDDYGSEEEKCRWDGLATLVWDHQVALYEAFDVALGPI
jgi:hypothetical protein